MESIQYQVFWNNIALYNNQSPSRLNVRGKWSGKRCCKLTLNFYVREIVDEANTLIIIIKSKVRNENLVNSI